jgi:outer membrane lipoprotein LolB
MNKLFKLILFPLVFLWLASCATVSTFHPVNPKASAHWRAQGKILVHYQEKAETASMDWQQNADEFDVRLYGPMGLGATELKGQSTDMLVSKQILGDYSLPVNQLIDWLKGIPTKSVPGWTVEYQSYHQNGMPKLVTISHQNLYLRIFIDKWQFF